MINILWHMEKFLVELMNWLPHFITQSIKRYDNLTRLKIHFFPSLFFWRTLHLISSFVHYRMIQLRYFWWNYFLNNFTLLDGLLRLVCLLMVHSYFIMIIIHQKLNFLKTNVLQKQFLYCFTWSTDQLLLLDIFSFSSYFFTCQCDFFQFLCLNLQPSTN